MSDIKLIAFDLDGTLTQHKSKLGSSNRDVLDKLSKKYKLLMVGAGQCERIFNQLDKYPVDIIGNYGMQYGIYNKSTDKLDLICDISVKYDKPNIEKNVLSLREKYNYTDYKGDNVEYHRSGCITIPLLGSEADLQKKLDFDPTREKRRKIYNEVKLLFSDYNVFVGGSSSFDLAPVPYDKYHALDDYCKNNGLSHENVIYVGDDYGMGGNDESVFKSDFRFLCIDDYNDFPRIMRPFL